MTAFCQVKPYAWLISYTILVSLRLLKVRKSFNMMGSRSVVQGRRFFVYSSNMVAVTSCEHTLQAGLECKFNADRLPMIVVAKKYICVATVHQ